MLLVRAPAPPERRRPAVLVLHGTGGNKEGLRGWLDRLASAGAIGVAIDGRYHGERAGAAGIEAYHAALIAAWRAPVDEQEHPFYYDTVWDVWRTVDYLLTRPDVDPDRLGIIGFSKGGIETWLAASTDDRLAVAVTALAVQSFRWSLEHDAWQGRAQTILPVHEAAARDLGEPEVNARVCRVLWSKLIPGILDQFDGPGMLPLLAPRPVLVLNGGSDALTPLAGAELAFSAAVQAYRATGAGERFQVIVAPGVGHAVTDEQDQAAQAWLARWLELAR
jgi:dienelactone hydrolase